jgi:hypothetical protein
MEDLHPVDLVHTLGLDGLDDLVDVHLDSLSLGTWLS